MFMYRKYLIILVVAMFLIPVGCSNASSASSPKAEVKVVQPVFQVVNLSVEPDVIYLGDNLTAYVSIVEANKLVGGTYTAVIKIDNEIVYQQNVDIPEGGAKDVIFTIPVNDLGQHEISIGDQTAKFMVKGFDTKNPVTIQYDHLGNGIPNFMYNGLFAYGDWGQMVEFTAPAYPFQITAIYMSAGATAKGNGTLEDKFFTVNIWDFYSGNHIWSKDYPWTLYGVSGSPTAKKVQIPEVVVQRDFNVEVVTHSDPPMPMPVPGATISTTMVGDTSMMVLDYESTQEFTRSSYSYNGKPSPNPIFKGNWVIRAIGYPPNQ